MKARSLKRSAAAAALLAFLIVLPGQAGADGTQTLTVENVSKSESGPTLEFTVKLSAGPDTAKFDYTTEDGTAKASSDYTTTAATGVTVAGGAEVKIQVPINDDDLDEPDQSFKLNISNIVKAANPTATATGTIVDNDATPTLTLSGPASVDEGAGNATYTIAIAGKSESAVTVAFATANGSAESGADYTATSGTLTWSSGETAAKTITVPILNDTLDEADENFSVNLSNPSGATITNGTVSTTITDNDDPPAARINDVVVSEGNTGTVSAVFTVTLSAPSGREVRVPWATAPGTATEPEDYVAGSGTVVIAAGQTTGTITVAVKGDTAFESNEQFSVVLVNPTNATLADNLGQGTITNDDIVPNPAVAAASVTEGNTGTTTLAFTVTVPARGASVTFTYGTVEGTATASGSQPDYQAASASGTKTYGPSATPTTDTILIVVNGDLLDEADETLTLRLMRDGVVVASAVGTIVDNDNNSKLSISDGSVDEPSTGTTTLKLKVTLSPASARAVRVSWATANGTASAGSDYTASSGTLDFAPGETSKEITIPVTGDTLSEDNETVLVNLTGATGAGVTDAQGIGTIVDKNAPPSLSIDDVLTREGETVTFTITLSGNTLRTVTVVAKTIEGTATEGSDFVARRSVLTFAPGEKSKTFQVPGIEDNASEPIETFFVGLEDVTNGIISKSRGTATVDASDQAPKVTATPAPPTPKPPPAPPRLLPKMLLGPRSVTVNAGVARMLVTCAKNSPLVCSGSVSFERVGKPKLVLGTTKFSVKAGKKSYVRIVLSGRALKLLAPRRTMQARAVVVVKTSTTNLTVMPGVITLKQGKPVAKSTATSTKVTVEP